VGVLDDPSRVETHVVGDHVARQADPARPGPVAEVGIRLGAADVGRDLVVLERICGRLGLAVAPPALDLARSLAPLPEPDEPEAADPEAGEAVELLVRDRVERVDVALMLACQLIEPDVRAFRDENEPRHPVEVLAEPLGLEVSTDLLLVADADEGAGAATASTATEPEMERA